MTQLSEITLVTGNADKLAEWQAIFGNQLELKNKALDIEEIQGDGDLQRILEHKARAAYDALQSPVIVEDIALCIDKFSGMPGPFVKYFLKDKASKSALWNLVGHEESRATIICSAAFYDGNQLTTAEGRVDGYIVKPRGERGFGFDFTFQPYGGDTRTFAEMSLEEKNAISHRTLAIKSLLEKLSELN